MKFIVYTDGGARGNPGPGAVGVIVKDKNGKVVKEIGKFIGKATNNEAEYKAVMEGLKTCAKSGAENLDFYIDSLLVVNQLNGDFKVKDKKIRTFWNEVKTLEKNFKEVSYTHIPRTKNFQADRIVNDVLDSL